MKYRVTIRGQKADYEREIECDYIDFGNSWWAVFVRAVDYSNPNESSYRSSNRVIAAIPAEHLNLIELVENTGR